MAARGPFTFWLTRILSRWNGDSRATSNTRNVDLQTAFKNRRDISLTSAFLSVNGMYRAGLRITGKTECSAPERQALEESAEERGSSGKVWVIGFFLHHVSHPGIPGNLINHTSFGQEPYSFPSVRDGMVLVDLLPSPRRAFPAERGSTHLKEMLQELL